MQVLVDKMPIIGVEPLPPTVAFQDDDAPLLAQIAAQLMMADVEAGKDTAPVTHYVSVGKSIMEQSALALRTHNLDAIKRGEEHAEKHRPRVIRP